MNAEYNYDAEGHFFPFFLFIMDALVTIPLTWNVLKPSTELEQTAGRIESNFKPKDERLIEEQRQRQKKKARKTKRIIAVVLGWLTMAYLLYLVFNAEQTRVKLWDPYDILGVSRSADERQIKRHYNRLAVKFHPDKVNPDPSKNETVQWINDRWVEMTKAFKALTDEEIRNNYLLYGNPDGKQGTSIGIALPHWMVEEGNRYWVLAFYGGLLGIALPYLLATWWYGTQSKTKERVLHASAANLFREWKEDIDAAGVVAALSVGAEYSDYVKADTKAAKLEGRVLDSTAVPEAAKDKIRSIEDPPRRKTLCLLWAYLARLDLGDVELEKEKYAVAPTAMLLNRSFSAITLPFQLLQPLLASFQASQHLIQATTPNSSPVLQLPHFTREIVAKISGAKSTSPLTIQKLMGLPASTRRSLCSDLSDSQYGEAMAVAARIPQLRIEKAFFKVVGDRVVTPSAMVQLVVKARAIPPATPAKDIPAFSVKDLEDKDPDEDDLAGQKSKDLSRESSEQPPLAHAPYYAANHAPRWYIFLAESRAGRIAVPPFTFTAFDKAAVNADGTPTFNMLTFRCQFQAPPQVASFHFTMYLVCDSYVGFDSKVDIVLDVKDLSEADVVESDDEISEPDEDSLAGHKSSANNPTTTNEGVQSRDTPPSSYAASLSHATNAMLPNGTSGQHGQHSQHNSRPVSNGTDASFDFASRPPVTHPLPAAPVNNLSRTDQIVLRHFWESKYEDNRSRDLHFLKFPSFGQFPSHKDLVPFCEVYHLIKTSPGAKIISLGSANGTYIGFELFSGSQLHIDMDDSWDNIAHYRVGFKSYSQVLRDPLAESTFKSWPKPLTIEFLEDQYQQWCQNLTSLCWDAQEVTELGRTGPDDPALAALLEDEVFEAHQIPGLEDEVFEAHQMPGLEDEVFGAPQIPRLEDEASLVRVMASNGDFNGDDEHHHKLSGLTLATISPSTLAVHADDVVNVVSDVAPPIHVSTTFRYPRDPAKLVPIYKQ
ncbi:hypothetical protein DV735_g5919, partial [Chaetothyriales sp. CBS 134920]